LTAFLYFWRVETSEVLEAWSLSLRIRHRRLQTTIYLDRATAGAARLGISGAVMLVIAYGLAISPGHYPPTVDAGRLTGGTHMAAALGMGFLWGAATALLLDLAVTYRKRLLAVLLVALYFSGLAAFHYRVQGDFVDSWRMQLAFWRSVAKECPDLMDGEVMLY